MSPTTKPKKGGENNMWLDAWYDPLAGLKAYNSCVCTADLFADGDWKLIVANVDSRLTIFKGSIHVKEIALLGSPTAVCSYFSDLQQPRIPSIAIASGNFIFIYRNLRPYYKFTLPSVQLSSMETEIWSQLVDESMDAYSACQGLSKLREEQIVLSTRSLDLLALKNPEQQQDYVAKYADQPVVVQHSCATCMATMKKYMNEWDAVGCLIVGTETKQILILNNQSSAVIMKCNLPSVPVFLATDGLYEVDYRITIACRNGNIYSIKNGEVMKKSIQLESQPVAMVRLENNIIIATMDKKLHSYHIKGKKNWSITMQHTIVALESMNLKQKKDMYGVFVAFENGTVQLYQDKVKVSEFSTPGSIMSIKFGSFTREEASLVIIHKSGAITVKLMKRNAKIATSAGGAGPPAEQDIPLNIPKKTKLYVEQTQRERDQAIDMHRIFQKDLCRLRLATARAYVKIISEGQGSVSMSPTASIRLNAQVQGIGPHFKIKINLQNSSHETIYKLPITLHFDHNLYRVKESSLSIPMLLPGIQYRYNIDVLSLSETGAADSIYIFVCSPNSCIPLVSAVVSMPISEPLLE